MSSSSSRVSVQTLLWAVRLLAAIKSKALRTRSGKLNAIEMRPSNIQTIIVFRQFENLSLKFSIRSVKYISIDAKA
jgi:hypothetical protein